VLKKHSANGSESCSTVSVNPMPLDPRLPDNFTHKQAYGTLLRDRITALTGQFQYLGEAGKHHVFVGGAYLHGIMRGARHSISDPGESGKGHSWIA
jgi:hypothetical protein